MELDLKKIREEINGIDDEIAELFEKRMLLARDVAEYKRKNDMAVYDRRREREIINRVSGNVSEELSSYSKILYATMFQLSRSYQFKQLMPTSDFVLNMQKAIEQTPKIFPQTAKVACQGVEGAYSQSACDRLFNSAEIHYFKTWEDVCNSVEKGECKYGVLPLENSTAGTVNAVYDLLGKYKFYIVRSIKLKIYHSLLAKRGTKLEDVKEIVSHEQAIQQCSKFINSLNVKVTVYDNTAAAAEYVAKSGRNDIAAIGSPDCADLYNLVGIKDDIMNTDNNYTRFICVSKNLEIYPGAHRTSVVFKVPHRPGALYDVLSKFRALDININKLESRPIPGRDFEFKFYFDMDVSVYRPELADLINELGNELESFDYLGSYTEIS
ncbi:MAG: bifunctional chorismate mutase/prephenate dehydratase [Acutalibacteraceae bacterium]